MSADNIVTVTCSVDNKIIRLNDSVIYRIYIENNSFEDIYDVNLKLNIPEYFKIPNKLVQKKDISVYIGDMKRKSKKTITFKLFVIDVPYLNEVFLDFVVEYFEDINRKSLRIVKTITEKSKFVISKDFSNKSYVKNSLNNESNNLEVQFVDDMGTNKNCVRDYSQYSTNEILNNTSSNEKNITEQGDNMGIDINKCGDICNKCCENDDKLTNNYFIKFNIFGNENCNSNFSNRLFLDNTGGRYDYVEGSCKINNKHFSPDFDVNCVVPQIISNKTSNMLSLVLKEYVDCGKSINRMGFSDNCQGFRLSQVIRNLGNLDKLDYCFNDTNKEANLEVSQKAKLIQTNCGKHVISTFEISNKGCIEARNILFNDLFPCDLLLKKEYVFIDGIKVCDKDIEVNCNNLFLRLQDLKPGKTVFVNVVLKVVGCIRSSNACQINYVSSAYIKNCKKTINFHQKLSNIKNI